jgi:hypothetical protein
MLLRKDLKQVMRKWKMLVEAAPLVMTVLLLLVVL